MLKYNVLCIKPPDAYMGESSGGLKAVGVPEAVGALGDKGDPGDKSFSCAI